MLLKQFLQFHAGKQPGKIADRSGKGENCPNQEQRQKILCIGKNK